MGMYGNYFKNKIQNEVPQETIQEQIQEEVQPKEMTVSEFYQDLFSFCADEDIELTEQAREEFQVSGIFDEVQETAFNKAKSGYNKIMEFFALNGIKLEHDQTQRLQEMFFG